MKCGSGLRVVIVNGRPGCGKTTFEDMCMNILGLLYCKSRSSIDKIKEIAREGGWNGEKDAASRKLLSDLKRIFSEYNDLPTQDIIQFLKGWESELQMYDVGGINHILFVDVREPENIEKLKKRLNAVTVLIRRPGDDDVEISNDSDLSVFNYNYDCTILNTGDLEHLKSAAQAFLNQIFSKNYGIIDI